MEELTQISLMTGRAGGEEGNGPTHAVERAVAIAGEILEGRNVGGERAETP
jgi:hypothetical protein